MDKALCQKYKRRHRKDLTPDEIDDIIRRTYEPFTMYRDIAQRFHITERLIGDLVKESKKRPEKLEDNRKK